LFVDGNVEGSIHLPGSRIIIGPFGHVTAKIMAREVDVQGTVVGNITATDLVEIRPEGSVTGDVAVARISIEDGGFFKGRIDIQKPEHKENKPVAVNGPHQVATMKNEAETSADQNGELLRRVG
jgi:cytoskeletal protein CcmA (bactofilin family)